MQAQSLIALKIEINRFLVMRENKKICGEDRKMMFSEKISHNLAQWWNKFTEPNFLLLLLL